MMEQPVLHRVDDALEMTPMVRRQEAPLVLVAPLQEAEEVLAVPSSLVPRVGAYLRNEGCAEVSRGAAARRSDENLTC